MRPDAGTRVLAVSLALALAPLALASTAGCTCNGSTGGTDSSNGPSDSGGGPADSGGGPGDSSVGSDATAPSDSGAVGATCGTIAGLVCDGASWCDFTDESCGGADAAGTCTARPAACTDQYAPVCGCDGMVYGNQCDAQAAGTDVSIAGGCTAPPYYFACGWRFCAAATEYCRRSVSDVAGYPDGWDCLPAPAACAGGSPSCACVAAEPCAAMCAADPGGGVTVTCPGG